MSSRPIQHLEPLPPHIATGSERVRQFAQYLGICGLILASMTVSQMLSSRPLITRWPILAGAGLLPLLAYLIATTVGHRSARSAAARHVPEPERPWTTAIQSCIARDRTTLSKAASERVWRSLLERADRPRVVADARIAADLAKAPDALLEPESIEPSQRGMVIVASLFAVLAGISLFDGGPSRWWNITIFVALAGFFAVRHPGVRNAFPGLRNTGRDLIAGPGWVAEAKRGTRWTIDDSLLLVQCQSATTKAGASPAIMVRLIGPPGVRDIQFASSKDPDFQLLWERWTTPRPRLEFDGGERGEATTAGRA
jgi:hypothetical protein